MTAIPLPFACLHAAYQAGAEDDHGNTVQGWATPVSVSCFWYPQTSRREFGDESVTNEQASVDMNLVVDISVVVDQRDRFTIEGKPFEVVGLPKEWDHGPFGFAPNRRVIELKWVG